jgi:formate/nitrite transporter
MIPKTGLKNRGWENQNRDAQGKLIRKDFHYKVYKNPNETILAVQEAGQKKSSVVWYRILMLAIMGGIYVGLGGTFAVTMAGCFDLADKNLTIFLRKLSFAVFFPVGLVFILLIGGELLTGNIMFMIVALLSRRIVWSDLWKNWGFSFIGNYAGTVLMAAVAYGCGFFASDPHLTYIQAIASGKVYSNWGVIFLKSIPCNFLVCAAIYIAVAAEDIPGKIIGMYLPISTFAAIGFEHSVANMFFVHVAMFYGADIGYGDWLYRNLLPVILGNLIGGGFFLACVYWFLYIAEDRFTVDHMRHNNRNQVLEEQQGSIVADQVIDKMQEAALKGGVQFANETDDDTTSSRRSSYDRGTDMPLEKRLADTNNV